MNRDPARRRRMTYQDLKYGDTFKLQAEDKMVEYDLYGHRCKDKRVFMKTNDGALQIYDCHGEECSKQNYRVYCYLTMPVYSVNVQVLGYIPVSQIDTFRLPVPDADHDKLCMNCNHLIFKDYKERCGQCRLTRLYRRFSDICLHEEEMS